MRTRAVPCLLALVLVTGCTPMSAPATSPTAAAQATLPCRLPIVSPTNPGDPPGGWITFPGAQFVRDPASLPGRLQTDTPSYDRAIGGWVPVSYEKVAPDGATYILHGDVVVTTNGFYLVDAKTRAQRLILAADGPPSAGGSWQIIDYASEGVYLWSVGIATVPGLWLLD